MMNELTPEEARRVVKIDPNLGKAKEMIVDYLEGRKSLEETHQGLRRIYCVDEIGIVITAYGEEFKNINAQALRALLKEMEV
jgi:hypothetical protein